MKHFHEALYMPDHEPQPGTICQFRLDNGLKINFLRSVKAPVVAVNLWYKVGSKNEEPGKSGFAHLFEHMMFQGSANVPKNQHMALINDVGGTLNGSTNKDRTNYYQVVPANQLRLALWLEADRMRSLAITEENFENQRATVKEERRQQIDNAPYMLSLYEQLDELVYQNWAYQHSIIGSMADLDAASLQDVAAFHQRFYQPNNAIMSVVGDVDMTEMLESVKELFADISAGAPVPEVDLSEPEQKEERRMEYRDPFAPLPASICAYQIPPRDHPDFYALEMIEKILFDGESSRMWQRLIEKDESVLHLSGSLAGRQGPGKLVVFAQLRPGIKMKTVQSALQQEIDYLQTDLVKPAECQKALNQFKSDFWSGMGRAQNRADALSFYTTYFDDPALLYKDMERYAAVTPEQIRDAAQLYLQKSKCSSIELYPGNS